MKQLGRVQIALPDAALAFQPVQMGDQIGVDLLLQGRNKENPGFPGFEQRNGEEERTAGKVVSHARGITSRLARGSRITLR